MGGATVVAEAPGGAGGDWGENGDWRSSTLGRLPAGDDTDDRWMLYTAFTGVTVTQTKYLVKTKNF